MVLIYFADVEWFTQVEICSTPTSTLAQSRSSRMRPTCHLLFHQNAQVAHILAALDLTVLIILFDYWSCKKTSLDPIPQHKDMDCLSNKS